MSSKRAAHNATKQLFIAILKQLAKGDPTPKEYAPRLYYLQSQGYIQRDSKRYIITKRGRQFLSEEIVWNLSIPTPTQWNGKWHLVLFDIPVDKRKRRDVFRLRLKELGLALYQNSVWVYPYPLEGVVQHIARFYTLSPCVSFIVAESLTGEAALLRHFKLKR